MTRFVTYRINDGIIISSGNAPDEISANLQNHGDSSLAVGISPPLEVTDDGLWQWTTNGYVHNASPAPTLAALQAQKLTMLSTLANDPVTGNLNVWSGGTAPTGGLQVDDISTARITSWATEALLCISTGATWPLPYWIMADNSHRDFATPSDFLTFAKAASTYKTAAVLNNSALKIQINAATDAATLAAIDITTGWPA